MKHKALIVLLGLFLSSGALKAQRQLNYTDFGFFVGTINYNGEVATGEISGYVSEIRPMGGLHLRRTVASWFTLGTEASYGIIQSKDVNHTNPERGLEVNTHMIQVNAFMELNFSKFGKYRRSQRTSFYIKSGGGINFYNPNIKEDIRYSTAFELRPNAYMGFNFFGGAGLKIRTSYQSYLSVEVTRHFCSFDDLEGFQYINNRTANDFYGGMRIGYSYMFF